MTLTTPYSATFYVGDGETKTFSYLFEEVSDSFISVVVYNSLTGLTSTPTYVIDTDQKQVIFGDDTPAPTDDETVCIYRNTPNVQDVAFRTLHGYDAKTLENILSKIVAMIQEIKSNYFSTQILQGDPWQLDLLSSDDDGATVNIDYTAKKLVKGLYFQITGGNLQVSADGSNYITMPKSSDIVEFRQHQTVNEDLTVEYRLQYRIGNTWYNAESNAEAKADEALQIAQDARDYANDAKDIAQDASDTVGTFDDRLIQAETDSSDAKNTVDSHVLDTNNPHQVTKAQVGLGDVDNTADLDKPISTATQSALDLKANSADIGNATLTIQKNGTAIDTFTANATADKTINITVPVSAADVNALPDTTKYAASASMTIDNSTYVVTLQLKDQDNNNLGSAQTIDLPLETMVVSGSYDNGTKKIILTLQNNQTIEVPVGDLISGLQTAITNDNKLSVSLIDGLLLSILGDVTLSSPQDKQVLRYNATTQKWENSTSTASVGFDAITGSPEDNAALATALNSAVHLSGNETITGIKTFQNAETLYVKNGNTFDGTDHFNDVLSCKDSTDTPTGYFRNVYNSVNTNIVDMLAVRKINGLMIYASIGVGITDTGYVYAFGPNIGDANNSKTNIELATKGWANDPSLSLNIVHRDGTETVSGTKTFSTSPLVPTVSSTTDNSTKAASTAHVINVLKAMYPVGAIFIGTTSTCPMAQFFGTWELVSSDRALWTGNGSNANTTIAAGLPNITGEATFILSDGVDQSSYPDIGALYFANYSASTRASQTNAVAKRDLMFDASRSSSIYGNSTTVQPPAYVVNVWRRTA